MRRIVLRGPTYSFRCYSVNEAKRLGFLDTHDKLGTHAPVSEIYKQGEGKLLSDSLRDWPDAILIATSRYRIVAYRPRVKLCTIRTATARPRPDL